MRGTNCPGLTAVAVGRFGMLALGMTPSATAKTAAEIDAGVEAALPAFLANVGRPGWRGLSPPA